MTTITTTSVKTFNSIPADLLAQTTYLRDTDFFKAQIAIDWSTVGEDFDIGATVIDPLVESIRDGEDNEGLAANMLRKYLDQSNNTVYTQDGVSVIVSINMDEAFMVENAKLLRESADGFVTSDEGNVICSHSGILDLNTNTVITLMTEANAEFQQRLTMRIQEHLIQIMEEDEVIRNALS